MLINKINSKYKKIVLGVLILVFFSGLVLVNPVAAADKCVIKLQVPLPIIGDCVSGFPSYITGFYKLFISVVGILAVIMIMVGGFQWLTAAGNAQKIGGAKTTIISAIMGLVLTLTSYTILNILNPDVLTLKLNPKIVSLEGGEEDEGTKTEPNKKCTVTLRADAATKGLVVDWSNGAWTDCGMTQIYDSEGQTCYGTQCSDGDDACLYIDGEGSCVETVDINDSSDKRWGNRTWDADEDEGPGNDSYCGKLYYNYNDGEEKFWFGTYCSGRYNTCVVKAEDFNIEFINTYYFFKNKRKDKVFEVGSAKSGWRCEDE